MERLQIFPGKLRGFGASEGCHFCVVTNPRYLDAVEIVNDAQYLETHVVAWDGNEPFGKLFVDRIPEESHVLAILPDTLLEAPSDADLGERRKLAVMACNSAPTSWEAVAHFVRAAERNDPLAHQRIADRFFESAENAGCLVFADAERGTHCVFDHTDERYHWFEQLGLIPWGGQQVFPPGEMSCFLVPPPDSAQQYTDISLDLDGELALHGRPILHSGPPSFLLEDQARLHESLLTLGAGALVAQVEGGRITELEARDAAALPARRTLEILFEVDSRFRRIFEIGFSINEAAALAPGNVAMNEIHGGVHGTVHFGLGMLPHTQYHLDLICPDTTLLADGETWMIGPPR